MGSGGRFPADGATPNGGPFYDAGGVAADGTTIDGSTQSDHFRLRWHIGADCNKPGHGGHDGHWPRNCNNFPYYPTWWSGWWGYGSGYNNYPNYVYSGPWYGTDPFVTQGTASTSSTTSSANNTGTTQAPRQLSPIELADEAWQSGHMNEAVRYFKEYLSGAPDDTDAMRFLALAYIDQKKLDEGVALMAMAYEKTPQLASRPLPAADIPGGDEQMRRRVNTMSAYANRTKTGSAWLMMAVLVQSEGREPIAKTMAERAAKAGLSEKVASELIGSLSD
jgi:tetratricopeptide (TPR) repeat protein